MGEVSLSAQRTRRSLRPGKRRRNPPSTQWLKRHEKDLRATGQWKPSLEEQDAVAEVQREREAEAAETRRQQEIEDWERDQEAKRAASELSHERQKEMASLYGYPKTKPSIEELETLYGAYLDPNLIPEHRREIEASLRARDMDVPERKPSLRDELARARGLSEARARGTAEGKPTKSLEDLQAEAAARARGTLSARPEPDLKAIEAESAARARGTAAAKPSLEQEVERTRALTAARTTEPQALDPRVESVLVRFGQVDRETREQMIDEALEAEAGGDAGAKAFLDELRRRQRKR